MKTKELDLEIQEKGSGEWVGIEVGYLCPKCQTECWVNLKDPQRGVNWAPIAVVVCENCEFEVTVKSELPESKTLSATFTWDLDKSEIKKIRAIKWCGDSTFAVSRVNTKHISFPPSSSEFKFTANNFPP